MKLEQISSWDVFNNIKLQVSDEAKSWLLEKGPITKRIKSVKKFRLELIQDKVANVEKVDKTFINSKSRKIRVREVVLFGNTKPMVFARTIIPNTTIEKGFAELGTLGESPLGDILFKKDIFIKENVAYASF
ncbi:MAG: chorismate lyase, partial [Gammaproteobacteria bacterium]